MQSLYRPGLGRNVVNELKTCKVDLAALQEVRWPGIGECNIEGYKLLYSGREDEIHREGVALCISPRAQRALIEYKPINERLLKARFRGKWFHLTVIAAYAPTEDGEEREKDRMYGDLQDLVDGTQKHDLLLVLGDMNAKVGRESFRSVGPESLHHTSNDNGLRLASFAEANNMIIGGTWYPHKNIHKFTWESPDGRTRNQIDHILVNAKHRGALQDVRCYRGADCSTDHLLLTAKVKAHLKLEQKMRNKPQRKFETERLKQQEISNQYQLEIRNRYEVLMMTEEEEMDMEEETKMLEECIIKSAEEIIGYKQNNRREEWYDDECAGAVEERKKARQKWQQTRSEEDLCKRDEKQRESKDGRKENL